MKYKTGIGLVILAIIIFPCSLFFNSIVKNTLNEESLNHLLKEQVLDVNSLAKLSITIVNEKAIEANTMKSAMIMAIFSKADTKKWKEFYRIALPNQLLNPVIDQSTEKLFDWIQNKDTLPDIKLQLSPFIENTRKNSSSLFAWAHQVIAPPIVSEKELSRLLNNNFGDSIPNLLMIGVPDSLKSNLYERGGELINRQLALSDIPDTIDTQELLSKKDAREKLIAVKSKIKRISNAANILWVLLLLVMVGFVLSYKNKIQTLNLVNKFSYIAGVWFLVVGWLLTNYIMFNLVIEVNKQSAPRGVRDLLIELIFNLFSQGSNVLYIVGSIILIGAIITSISMQIIKTKVQ